MSERVLRVGEGAVRMRIRRGTLLSVVSLFLLGALAIGCTSSKKTTINSSAASPGAGDFSNGGAAYQSAVSTVNNSLNGSEQYALTPSDLQALSDEGVVDDEESSALNVLVKK